MSGRGSGNGAPHQLEHPVAAVGMIRGSSPTRCETDGFDLPAGAPSQLQFKLPVDVEHKATRLVLLSAARPHMLAFHTSWVCLFLTFTTTFAPAALLPVLQDALNLTPDDISNAGIASMCGTIFSRVAMGTLTDVLGPRYSAAIALLLTAPLMFGITLIETAAGFIALRMLVGLGLSMFVVNQSWMSGMFNRQVLGRATALSAGLGNTGFGVTLLLMPLLFEGFNALWGPGLAWRAAFFVPAGLQTIAGMLVLLLADDTPEGRYPQLYRGWCKPSSCACRGSSLAGWRAAVWNPRTYLLAAAYAACFGVELTVANIVSLYLFNHFCLSLTAAGFLGGSLGLMNLFSRYLGGAASDRAADVRGMRGRMWVLLLLLLLQGVLCLLVGITHNSLAGTLAMLYPFCFFGQMACGAVFGIVPFLSHRRSGLTIGVVAAGGNVGAAVMQALFFGFVDLTPYEGFYWMGATIICLGALTCLLLYWPMWGGLLCGSDPNITEERFYLSEYTSAERAAGKHLAVLAFAHEAHRERDPQGPRSFSCEGILPSLQLPGCCLAQCCCCGETQHSSSSNSSSSSNASSNGVGDVHSSGAGRTDGGINGHRRHSTGKALPQLPAPSQAQVRAADVQLVPVYAAGSSTPGSSSTCIGRGSGSSHGGTRRYDQQQPASAEFGH